jgi:hypothetical protein
MGRVPGSAYMYCCIYIYRKRAPTLIIHNAHVLLFGHLKDSYLDNEHNIHNTHINNLLPLQSYFDFLFHITIYQNIIGNIDQLLMSSYIHKNYCFVMRENFEREREIKEQYYIVAVGVSFEVVRNGGNLRDSFSRKA